MLAIFKYLFIFTAFMLFVLISYGKLFVFNKKDAMFISDYTSSIALFLVLYVLTAIIGTALVSSLYKELTFLFFALSPFCLGYIAKYETEKYFTIFQLFLFILSVVFALGL